MSPSIDFNEMVAMMIINKTTSTTKYELIRSLYKQRVAQIEAIEPYDPTKADDRAKPVEQFSYRVGQLALILTRTT